MDEDQRRPLTRTAFVIKHLPAAGLARSFVANRCGEIVSGMRSFVGGRTNQRSASTAPTVTSRADARAQSHSPQPSFCRERKGFAEVHVAPASRCSMIFFIPDGALHRSE